MTAVLTILFVFWAARTLQDSGRFDFAVICAVFTVRKCTDDGYSVLPPKGSIFQDDNFPDILVKFSIFNDANHGVFGVEELPIDDAIQEMQQAGSAAVEGWITYSTPNRQVTLLLAPVFVRERARDLLKRVDCEAAARIVQRFIHAYEFVGFTFRIINIHQAQPVGLGVLDIVRN